MLALASSLGIGRFVLHADPASMAAALGFGAGRAGLIASANFAATSRGVGAMAPGCPAGAGLVRRRTAGGRGDDRGDGRCQRAEAVPSAALPGRRLQRVRARAGDRLRAGRAGRGRVEWAALAALRAGVGLGIAVSAIAVSAFEASRRGLADALAGGGGDRAAMIPAPAPRCAGGAAAGGACVGRARLGPGPAAALDMPRLFGLGYVVTATFLVAMVRASAAGRASNADLAVVGPGRFPSLLLWDRVAARLGRRPAYAAAPCSRPSACCWPPGGRRTAGLVARGVLFGGTFMGLTALGFAVAREFGSGGARAPVRGHHGGFGLGQAIGPVVGGAVSDWRADSGPVGAGGGRALVASVIMLVS